MIQGYRGHGNGVAGAGQLTANRQLKVGVEDLLVRTFGSFKAGRWSEIYDRALAQGPGLGWYVADEQGQVVGVALGEVADAAECTGLTAKLNLCGFSTVPQDAFGTLAYLAVARSHQRRGIGTDLGQRVFQGLAGCGVTVMWGNSLQHSGTTSDSVFLGAGFRRLGTLRSPFAGDPSCTECEVDPCLCTATVYAKRVCWPTLASSPASHPCALVRAG